MSAADEEMRLYGCLRNADEREINLKKLLAKRNRTIRELKDKIVELEKTQNLLLPKKGKR